MMNKVRKNVVLELSASSGGQIHFRLHLGNREALPPDFMRRYCAESLGEKRCGFSAAGQGRVRATTSA